jgi:hypothetical protein
VTPAQEPRAVGFAPKEQEPRIPLGSNSERSAVARERRPSIAADADADADRYCPRWAPTPAAEGPSSLSIAHVARISLEPAK